MPPSPPKSTKCWFQAGSACEPFKNHFVFHGPESHGTVTSFTVYVPSFPALLGFGLGLGFVRNKYGGLHQLYISVTPDFAWTHPDKTDPQGSDFFFLSVRTRYTRQFKLVLVRTPQPPVCDVSSSRVGTGSKPTPEPPPEKGQPHRANTVAWHHRLVAWFNSFYVRLMKYTDSLSGI